MKRFVYLWYWGVGLCCQMSVMANAATSTDAYIAGYAAAVLEQTFHVSSASLQVQDGELQLNAEDLTGVDQDQLMKALLQIQGVRHVELRRRQQLLASTPGEVASSPRQPYGARPGVKRRSLEMSLRFYRTVTFRSADRRSAGLTFAIRTVGLKTKQGRPW